MLALPGYLRKNEPGIKSFSVSSKNSPIIIISFTFEFDMKMVLLPDLIILEIKTTIFNISN